MFAGKSACSDPNYFPVSFRREISTVSDIVLTTPSPIRLRGGNDKDFKTIVFTKKTPKPPTPKAVKVDDDAVPLPSVPHELKMAIMKARQVFLEMCSALSAHSNRSQQCDL